MTRLIFPTMMLMFLTIQSSLIYSIKGTQTAASTGPGLMEVELNHDNEEIKVINGNFTPKKIEKHRRKTESLTKNILSREESFHTTATQRNHNSKSSSFASLADDVKVKNDDNAVVYHKADDVPPVAEKETDKSNSTESTSTPGVKYYSAPDSQTAADEEKKIETDANQMEDETKKLEEEIDTNTTVSTNKTATSDTLGEGASTRRSLNWKPNAVKCKGIIRTFWACWADHKFQYMCNFAIFLAFLLLIHHIGTYEANVGGAQHEGTSLRTRIWEMLFGRKKDNASTAISLIVVIMFN